MDRDAKRCLPWTTPLDSLVTCLLVDPTASPLGIACLIPGMRGEVDSVGYEKTPW